MRTVVSGHSPDSRSEEEHAGSYLFWPEPLGINVSQLPYARVSPEML